MLIFFKKIWFRRSVVSSASSGSRRSHQATQASAFFQQGRELRALAPQ